MTRYALAVAVLLITSLAASPARAQHGPGYLWDPVVTHTNGMRIASTESQRSHNVYWQCQDGRVGYCDGQMHGPCHDELRTLGTRCHGRFVPPYTPQGPASSQTHHTLDGLETTDSETLGQLAPRQLPGAPGAPSQAIFGAPQTTASPLSGLLPTAIAGSPEGEAASAPEGEATWVDALQTIGRKIAQPE